MQRTLYIIVCELRIAACNLDLQDKHRSAPNATSGMYAVKLQMQTNVLVNMHAIVNSIRYGMGCCHYDLSM